jgi:hypothetical protein
METVCKDGVDYDTKEPYLELQPDGTCTQKFWTPCDFLSPSERAGRKSNKQVTEYERVHDLAVEALYAASPFTGALAPPQLKSLPLIATWYLYRCRMDVRQYLSAATLLKHRRAIQLACGLDILIPLR